MPAKAVYAASKSLVFSFSLALREELRASAATVTVLCPAGLATTEQAVRDIEAQGILGRLTTIDVARVASRTLDRALRGRAVYVPGFANQFLRALKYVLSPTAAARLIAARWCRQGRRSGAGAPLVSAPEAAR
jgi:short-subunit dehydrogenase